MNEIKCAFACFKGINFFHKYKYLIIIIIHFLSEKVLKINYSYLWLYSYICFILWVSIVILLWVYPSLDLHSTTILRLKVRERVIKRLVELSSSFKFRYCWVSRYCLGKCSTKKINPKSSVCFINGSFRESKENTTLENKREVPTHCILSVVWFVKLL